LPEQLCPWVHVPQKPLPSHTWFMPQLVPAVTFPDPSTQLCTPVAHEVTPFLHADGLPLQPMPAAHMMHVPEPLQTMSVPQPVPAILLPPSRQSCTPVVQDVMPFRQPGCGFVVQAWPAAQIVHWPLALQTWLVPQVVPAAFMVPSTQTCAPVVHDVTPS
jgi:hypothetical protein